MALSGQISTARREAHDQHEESVTGIVTMPRKLILAFVWRRGPISEEGVDIYQSERCFLYLESIKDKKEMK